MEISLDADFTTKTDIIKCIIEFRKIQSGENPEKKIVLTAKRAIKEIDISMIAYFILFVEEIDELEIILNLPFNEQGNGEFEKKLKQYGVFSYLMTGKGVFKVLLKGGDINFGIQDHHSFPPDWFELPEDFMPLLYINKENILLRKLLLESEFYVNLEMSFENTQGIVINETSEDELYAFVKDEILKKSVPADKNGAIINLGRLAFLSALHKANLLSFCLYQSEKGGEIVINNEIFTGNYIHHKKSEKTFHKDILTAFSELSTKPLIYQFLFSMLLSKKQLAEETSEAAKTAYLFKIYNLLNFIQDLVYGIKELAKNIIDHSTTKKGVISGKLYSKSAFDLLAKKDPNLQAVFSGYLTTREAASSTSNMHFLDLYIMDIGDAGVVPTLYTKSKEIADKENEENLLKKFFTDDLITIRNIKFSDLLYPRGHNMLSHQAKRSVAHLGLLIFTKLIEKNNGLVVASSDNFNRLSDVAVLPTHLDSKLQRRSEKLGTSYHIILPVSDIRNYRTHLPHTIELPKESTFVEVKGIEKLIEYKALDLTKSFMPINTGDSDIYIYILTYKNRIKQVISKEDEITLWVDLKNEFAPVILNTEFDKRIILNWDFSEVALDASQLFRALGNWMAEFPSVPLIVSNIQTSLLNQINLLNKHYCEAIGEDKIDFWNANAAVLVYNYIGKARRFYFADALWGKTEADFITINRLIERNNINYTLLLGSRQRDGNIAGPENPLLFLRNTLFFNQKSLLPFDLLLSSGRNSSIFDENIITLLNNEIAL